ncbi:protein PF14_0175-like, partial [Rhopalosiphum maidis]|uniref:protein PF14_0175-like n=1 Tax=Rhopalosiphum maidis TaxID=43146 RepID=UPI000F005264
MKSNSSDNINKNKKILNLKKPNNNKFKDMLKNKKQPTNTLRNKIKQPNQSKKPNNINENVSNQEIITSNLPNSRDILIISYDEPELRTKTNGNIAKNNPVNDEINTLMEKMNSNSEEDSDEQNSSSHSSLKPLNQIPKYSIIEDNKHQNILKNIKHNKFKPKSRKLGKRQIKKNEKPPEINKKKISNPSRLSTINEKGLQPKKNKPINPSKSNQKTPSIIIPKNTKAGNANNPQGIPGNDEIDALMKAMNSDSDEDSADRNSESNPSSLETKHGFPDNDDLESRKERDILKNIKHQLGHQSKKEGKIGPNKDEELPETNKRNANSPSGVKKGDEDGSNPKRATPITPSKSNQQTPTIIIPKNTKAENTDNPQGIPGNDEIDALINDMNSESDEDSAHQNSESNPSSLETKQDIPDDDNLGSKQEHDILKNIKDLLRPQSKKQGKIGPNKDEELPETNKRNANSPSGVKKGDEDGSNPKRATPITPSKSNQQTPTIIIPKNTKAENTDNPQGIPGNDEIDALIKDMNSESDENSAHQNSESSPSSLETKQDIPDDDNLGSKQEHDILKNIKDLIRPQSKKQGKIGPNKDEELPETNKRNANSPSGVKKGDEDGSNPKRATPITPSKSNQKTPTIIIPKNTKAENTDNPQGIPGNDEIDALINDMNSESDEDSAHQNSESSPSSLETKQDIPDNNNLGSKMERDILKDIKHPLRPPQTKKQGKIGPNKDEELPETNKRNVNSPSGVKKGDENSSNPKRATPITPSKSNQQTPTIIIPKNTKAENTDNPQGIPGNDEIDALINDMNSESNEDSAHQNSESNPSSLETKQDIPDDDNLGSKQEHDILKNIKDLLRPQSKKQGKIGPNKDEELPETNKRNANSPSGVKKGDEDGSNPKRATPITPRKSNQQTPTIIIPKNTKAENTDNLQGIPGNDEIDAIINDMNSESDEDSAHQNSESNPSSLETKQDIPDNNNLGSKMERDILKDIKHPLRPPQTKKQGKIGPNKDEELPETKKRNENFPSGVKNNDEKGLEPKNAMTKSPTEDNQPTSLNSNTGNTNPENTVGDDNNINSTSLSPSAGIKENLKSLPDIHDQINLDDKSDSNLIEDLLNSPIGIDGEDSPKTVTENENNIPNSEIDNKLQNSNDDTLTKSPTEDDVKPNQLQENKSTNDVNPLDKTDLKNPESADGIFPTESKDLKEFLAEIPFDDIDEPHSLEEFNNLGGITMEDIDKNKKNDISPSSTLNDNKKNDLDDNVQKTNQPTSLNSNTGNTNPENTVGDDNNINSTFLSPSAGIKENLKSLPDIHDQINLDDNSDSNLIEDLLNSPIGIDGEDSPKTVTENENNIPNSEIDNKLQNSNDDTLTKSPTEDDVKPNPLQENKSTNDVNPLDKTDLKNPESADGIFPTESKELKEFLAEIPFDDIDEPHSLEEFNNLGGITMKDIDKNKKNDISPSSTLNDNKKNDLDDNVQKTNQPTSLNSNTGNTNPENTVGDDNYINSTPLSPPAGIKENLKSLPDIHDQINLDDKSDSNLIKDLLNSPIGIDGEDSPKTVTENENNIPNSEIDNKLQNSNDDTLTKSPTEDDVKPNPLKENKSTNDVNPLDKTDLKNPESADGIFPTESKELKESLAEIPYDNIDEPHSLEEFNNLGGITMEDIDKNKKNDISPSSTLNDNKKNDLDDNVQKTNQPTSLNSNTGNTNPENTVGDDNYINSTSLSPPAGIKENLKSLPDIHDQIILDDKSDSNLIEDLLNSPIGIDEKDSPKTATEDANNIPNSEIDNKLQNSNDDTLTKSPTEDDVKPNPLQENKSTNDVNPLDKTDLKNPESADGIFPIESEELKEFLAEIPYNYIDEPHSLEEFNNLGGITMEDIDKNKKNDISPSSTLNDNKKNDLDDSVQKTNQPTLLNSNTGNTNPENTVGDDNYINSTSLSPPAGIKENLKSLPDIHDQINLDDKSDSNLIEDLLNSPIGIDGKDSPKTATKDGNNIPNSEIDNKLQNSNDDTLTKSPTEDDVKPNPLQENKSTNDVNPLDKTDLKNPESADGIFPTESEELKEFLAEIPYDDIDEPDSLEEFNNLGGITMEDIDKNKKNDISPSSTLNDNKNNDLDDNVQKTNQPTSLNSNTGNTNPENTVGDDNYINSTSLSPPAGIKENLKSLPDIHDQINLDDKSDSNLIEDLLNSPIGIDGKDSPKTATEDANNIPNSEIDNKLQNSNDDTLTKSPTEDDVKPNPLQENKSTNDVNPLDKTDLKNPESADGIFPTESEELKEFLAEIPYDDIDEPDSLEEFNNLGGITMEDIDKNKNNDISPSSTLNDNKKNDLDDNVQNTNQPTSLNSNTGNTNPENTVGDDNYINSTSLSPLAGIKENLKSLPDIHDQINLDDKSDSNLIEDLLNSPIGIDGKDSPKTATEDANNIPNSEIDNKLQNSNDDTLTKSPTEDDVKPNPLQENKSTNDVNPLDKTDLKNPESADGIFPTESEELKEFLAEIPYDDIDEPDSLEEFNNLGGITMEDIDKNKNNDISPSSTLNVNKKNDLDDSVQKTNQPTSLNSNTGNTNPENTVGDDNYINSTSLSPPADIKENLKSLPDIHDQLNLDDKSDSNLIEDLLNSPIGIDGKDSPKTATEDANNIPNSEIDNKLQNSNDDTLTKSPTDDDVKPNPLQENKSTNDVNPLDKTDLKNPESADGIFPTESEELKEFLAEIPYDDIDEPDSLEEFNNLGGITMEDIDKNKNNDISPSSTLNDNKKNDLDDSVQKTNQPTSLNSNTGNTNPENTVADDNYINSTSLSPPADIKENLKSLPDIHDQINLDDKSDSNLIEDLLNSPIGIDGKDSPKTATEDANNIPNSEIDNKLQNSNDDTLTKSPTEDDVKPNPLQENKSTNDVNPLDKTDLKNPESADGIFPTESEELKEFLAEIPYDDIDEPDSLEEFNNLGGITMEDIDKNKKNDISPSSTLNDNKNNDLDDNVQKTNQPTSLNSNTGNTNPENTVGDDNYINSTSLSPPAGIKENLKSLPDIHDQINLDDKSDSNLIEDLLNSPIGIDGKDSPKTATEDANNIPNSEIDNKLQNSNDDTLTKFPTEDDVKPNPLQENKSTNDVNPLDKTDLKNPESADGIFPIESKELKDFFEETPYDDDNLTDISGKYNNLGIVTMEDSDVKSNPENNVGDNKNINSPSPCTQMGIEENPKSLSDIQDKINLDNTSDSNIINDLLGSPVGLDGVESPKPVIDDTNVIPISRIDDVLHNSNDDTLTTTSPFKVINTNPFEKNISTENVNLLENTDLKSPEITDGTVPIKTDELKEFLGEIPYNYDTSDIRGEYNNLSLTVEDIDKNKRKDSSPSSTLNNIKNIDLDDSLQKINQPTPFNSNTGNTNPENTVGDDNYINSTSPSTPTGIKKNPKKAPERQDKINLYNTSESNIIKDLLGSPIGLDESPSPAIDNTNIIPKSKINNKLHNSNEDALTSTLRPPSDKIMNVNKKPLSEISLNGIDMHSSGLNLMHNYNKLDNGDDINVNHGDVTNSIIDYNSNNTFSLEGGNSYGYMIPKFSTKYIEGGDSNYNLWETIPPKRNYDISIHNGYDNYINDLNQSTDYTLNNNKIPSYINNEKNIVTKTETIKNNYNDIVNTDNHDSHNKLYDDFIKKMSEQLLNKIDNIDDKLSKLDKLSKNCSYMRENDNIGSHDSSINKVVLLNDIPTTKPEKIINIEESDSKTDKPIESLEIKTSNKRVDGNETKDSTKAKKHKNKKHEKHEKHNKKKDHKKNNISNENDDDDDDDDD